jgi:hypothetical protein
VNRKRILFFLFLKCKEGAERALDYKYSIVVMESAIFSPYSRASANPTSKLDNY